MVKRMVSTGLVVAAMAFTTACKQEGGQSAEAEKDVFKEVSVAELSQMVDQGKVKLYDVNNDDFRKDNGKLPGAVLLASSHNYDLSVLPADKKEAIAFYCSSRR